MSTMKRLPKRVTPQQDAAERIAALMLRMAIERDSRLTPQEEQARRVQS